jgi:ABC-type branched-subunit amino acid transport system substrate-binding protein
VAGGDAFSARYAEVSGGVAPGRLALPAYEATWLLIEAIEASLVQGDLSNRETVRGALCEVARVGLLGTIKFDSKGVWSDAPLYSCEVDAPSD